MRHYFISIFLLVFINTFSQVGIGTQTPDASSILELNSETKGFLLPRMTKSQRDAIQNPAKGLVVYCSDCNSENKDCITANYGTPAAPNWECVGVTAPVTPSVSAVCNGFVTGNYVAGFATNGTYTVTVTNNSFSTATIGFQSSDLQLSGVSGLDVGTPIGTPALTSGSATLNAGQAVTVSYPITGNPSTTGTLKGDWNKLALSCSATKSVTGISTLLANTYCTDASVNGKFVSAVAFTSTNTFKITLTNTSGSAISGLPAPTISNLGLSYDGSGTLTVASVTPSTTFNLANNASQEIVYTLSGTPTSVGTLSLNWNYADLSCSKTRYIGLGDATFTSLKNNAYVFSVNDPAVPLDSQGTLAISTTVSISYTDGSGSYIAYSSPFIAIPSQFCEDGASDWTFGYSYNAGTFTSTGSITATLITKRAGVITAWQAKRVPEISTINFDCVSQPLVCNNNTYSNSVGIDEGGDAIRGSIAIAGNTSGAAYDAAAPDNWVKITAAEYDQMAITVNSSYKAGTSDTALNAMSSSNAPFGYQAGAYILLKADETTVKTIPANHYVFAVKLKQSSISMNESILLSTGQTGTISFYGLNALPNSGTSGGYVYYVLKRPSGATPATRYLGATSYTGGLPYTNGYSMYWNWYTPYSTSGLTENGFVNYTPGIQSLSSTMKQW